MKGRHASAGWLRRREIDVYGLLAGVIVCAGLAVAWAFWGLVS